MIKLYPCGNRKNVEIQCNHKCENCSSNYKRDKKDLRPNKLSDLIEALQIFLKYDNIPYPTHCEHDELFLCMGRPENMTDKDFDKLEELGFNYDEDEDYFSSFTFGSS